MMAKLLRYYGITSDTAYRMWDVALVILKDIAIPSILILIILWQIIRIIPDRYELYELLFLTIPILLKLLPLALILAITAYVASMMWMYFKK